MRHERMIGVENSLMKLMRIAFSQRSVHRFRAIGNDLVVLRLESHGFSGA